MIESQIKTIKKALAEIEEIEANKEISSSEEQLLWLVTSIEKVTQNLDSHINYPSRKKSYSDIARSAKNRIDWILSELEIWRKHGIKPEHYEENKR